MLVIRSTNRIYTCINTFSVKQVFHVDFTSIFVQVGLFSVQVRRNFDFGIKQLCLCSDSIFITMAQGYEFMEKLDLQRSAFDGWTCEFE